MERCPECGNVLTNGKSARQFKSLLLLELSGKLSLFRTYDAQYEI